MLFRSLSEKLTKMSSDKIIANYIFKDINIPEIFNLHIYFAFISACLLSEYNPDNWVPKSLCQSTFCPKFLFCFFILAVQKCFIKNSSFPKCKRVLLF